ncbi:caspase-8-like [Gadus chalcogrammus]|uniref:caspase-8-like n=1 Tax=Gadus chalcogrammus TaxID=1042646 RepID=UPI0024C4E5CA|nr:caspase-8-like [Gadus chalcogrammus]
MCLQDGSKMGNVYGKLLELKECHVADRTGKMWLQLWGGCIGQVEQDESYVLENLSVREGVELYLTTTKNTTIRISEEKVQVPESVARQRLQELDAKKYPMSGPQRGYCLIVNNFDFSRSSPKLSNRTGTVKDAESLSLVFSWLGFQVEEVKDATRDQMLSSMRELASRDHSGMDCVACVVLSHGLEGGVYGVDGGVVRLEKLKWYVNGEQCSSLIGKPKLFFIQACQGIEEEKAVPVPADGPVNPKVHDQTDGPSGSGVPAQTDGPSHPGDIRSDFASATESIPITADFLTAMATTPSYVSLRDRKKGTWFIQSVCKNLELLVRRDLLSILTEVNNDVSQMSDPNSSMRQMPQPIHTLRMSVFFPVPEKLPPSLPTSCSPG